MSDSSLEDTLVPSRPVRRRRAIAAVAVIVLLGGVAGLVVGALDDSLPPILVPRRDTQTAPDPLAYRDEDASALEREAAFGLSHPLYAKSPGGVIAAARRTASFRALVENAVTDSGFDADILEAIVFLESGGRPDVIAGDDPSRASGLTQILAETGQNFLGMPIDLPASRRLSAGIAAAAARGEDVVVERLREERRAVDARFDPERALAATVRYLETARQRLGRDDLAVVSYHMGIGNLSNVLRAYAGESGDLSIPALVADRGLSWARVFFDTTPARNVAAHELLARLGDDSPTYYWRVLAAKEIMRLYRSDPERLTELASLHTAKASAEEVLHPKADTRHFSDAADLERAWRDHTLEPLPDDPARLWFAVDPTMGELAPQLGRPEAIYRGLRAEALALLTYVALRVHVLSGSEKPLEVTSTVRDDAYQQLLRDSNPEATWGYSLHTTGYAFDVRRSYESPRQAAAFQFLLDDLSARGLIAWVREPAAIHITVSSAAGALVPALLEPKAEG